MSGADDSSADRRILRWYPARWRDRYGDELLALVEDETGGSPPGPKMRVEIACAGLRQRARDAALVGHTRSRSEQMWTGALTVLVGWAAFMLGGASFQRQSEHFVGGVPASARAVPVGAFDTIRVLALLGGSIVVLGALATLPAFIQMVRRGGWRDLRRSVAWVAGTSAVCIGSLVGLAAWAHSLDSATRNGGSIAYSLAFVAFGLVAAVTLGAWTALAVVAARKLEVRTWLLYIESVLALCLALVMTLLLAATALWWESMAKSAAWVIAGTPQGTHPAAVSSFLVCALASMSVGVVISLYGAWRIARGSPHPRWA